MTAETRARKCLGYGPTEGKCQKPAGCPHSPYWCVECNALRMDAISEGFRKIIAGFEERRTGK